MKKLVIVSAFVFVAFFGARFTNAEVVQTEQRIKCIPTYTNPCTNEGLNLGAEVLGNNNSGGISNPGNKDPKDYSGAINTLGQVTNLLKLNSTGTAVKALQEVLIAQGYLTGVPDGKFGAKTQSAVKSLQKVLGLKIDGIVGPQTIKTIKNNTTSGGSTTQNTNTNTNTSTNTKTNTNANTQNNTNSPITISFVKKNNKNTLLKNYACKDETKDRMYVAWGEVIDEVKNSIYRMNDVWSTADGINWKQESTDIATGEKWEPMVVNTGKEVYVFGGKYKKDSSSNDNTIYKSTNMIDWSYVGELPDLSRYYDKSVVYFKNKFWLIASEEGKNGVWSSADGVTWTQELSTTPWDGAGRHRISNSKGNYDSNSLGAYVLGGKIWYMVFHNQTNATNPQITMYSTSDGKTWKNEGLLVDNIKNYGNANSLNIGTNTNPTPVIHNGKVWIMTTMFGSNTPIVLNSSNGKTWNLLLGSEDRSNYAGGLMNTDFAPGYYSSDVSFNGKLWKIGGLNYTSGNDNAVYSSKDGVTWEKVDIKGTTFAGPQDRHLAGVTVLKKIKSKATDLKIEREYNATGFFTGSDEVGTTLGKWNLIASSDKNKSNNGAIAISSFSFVGNSYKPSTGKDFSTLESLSNIGLYIDGVKVGSISKFTGPFYDSAGKALTQTVKLDKSFTLNNQDSVWLEMKADFPAPKWNNLEMRTFLNGITFKDGYTTPCLVYSEDTSGGYEMIPGRNIYFKR